MFKGNKKYFYIFAGLFGLIILVQYLLPKPINWNHTYLAKDKAPFGAYAVRNLLPGIYSGQLTENNQTFYNLNEKISDSSSVLLINDKFAFNKSDVRSLFELLQRGNKVFIAANQFEGIFADTLHITTHYDFSDYFSSIDSLLNKPGEAIKLKAQNHRYSKYIYSQAATMGSFRSFDSTRFRVLATIQDGKACLISASFGKGTLYLMSVPDVFANNFIVNSPNRELAYTMLTLLKNKQFVWDEYYKTFNVTNYSMIKFILESDALYSAYLLLFFTLILYMIFEGRRRQRAIPIVQPVTNSTLEFVNVISHVYFSSNNHRDIAIERIKYFYETIRTKFNVVTTDINEQLVKEIAELSGIEHKLVKQLFAYCEKIKNRTEISEYDLIELNRQISNFNKNSLR
ncbi:MAG: DUF4350 domain-containing protein [Bacteroidetes bacterium]|nr:DUF4350 domain-containing protein [Bacteroidota bacterium]